MCKMKYMTTMTIVEESIHMLCGHHGDILRCMWNTVFPSPFEEAMFWTQERLFESWMRWTAEHLSRTIGSI